MIKTYNIVRVYYSPEISIAPMTAGRVAGGDCDILVLDEGGWIRKDLQAYQMYRQLSHHLQQLSYLYNFQYSVSVVDQLEF